MRNLIFFLTVGASLEAAPVCRCAEVSPEPAPDGKPHIFSFKDGGDKIGEFLLDGKPFQIRSGEIHPQRVPEQYWRHRVRMAKAMGCNTVAFYIFWNAFERPDGSFGFTGRNDLGRWLEICREEKMWTLFRPGPYACGEWDMGGLPPRLLKDPQAGLRTMKDPVFIREQDRYIRAVAEVARRHLCKNGGTILMTQLENEYGSYNRRERAYMCHLRDLWTELGFGPFYTSDGGADHYLRGIVLPGVAVGLDPGENNGAWEAARRNNPGVPVFSSETYPGWLRHWGEGNWRPSNKSRSLHWFMKGKKSYSLFVFHGGSNFGFTAGANNGGRGGYQPDLTSYDYGSPCNEQGAPAPEYMQYRKILISYLPWLKDIPVPDPVPSMDVPAFTPAFFAPLEANRGAPRRLDAPACFEALGQNQGIGFYETTLPAGPAADLSFRNLHDFGQIFLDGKWIATVDRREGKRSAALPARDKPAKLEILVEAMGHINFSPAMDRDRKGLYGEVKLGGKPLAAAWTFIPKPLAEDEVCAAAKPAPRLPGNRPGGHYRGSFTLDGDPADTFLDMSKWKKGTLYVNGHNLGRYWSIGPQLRLYCPAPFLKRGVNTVDVIELCDMPKPMPIRGCKTRNYDMNDTKTANLDNQW